MRRQAFRLRHELVLRAQGSIDDVRAVLAAVIMEDPRRMFKARSL